MIIRSKRQHNFTIIPNALARDHNLSMKDKGLLIDMLSYPDNWHFHLNALVKQYKKTSSESSIRRVLKSLRNRGYIAKGTMHRRKGKYRGRDLIVYDHPVHVKSVHNEQKSRQNGGKSVHNEQNGPKTAVQVRTPVAAVHNEHSPLSKYEQWSKSSNADNHIGSSTISNRCSSTNTYKYCNTVNKKDYRKNNKKKSEFKDPFSSHSKIKDPFTVSRNANHQPADKAAGFTPLLDTQHKTNHSSRNNEINQLFTEYKNYFQDTDEDRDIKVKELLQDCITLPKYKYITFNDLKHEIQSLISFNEYGHKVRYTAVFIKRGLKNLLRRKRAKKQRQRHAEINRDKKDRAYNRYMGLPTDKQTQMLKKEHYQSPAGHPDKDSIKFLKNQEAYYAEKERKLNKKL